MSLLNKASLIQIPSGYKDGTLYSAKPTNGDGDFTFSRGSNLAATRVNSEGLIEKGRENLLLQSNQFDTTWGNNNSTETGGQTGYDGSSNAWLLANTAAGGSIGQTVSNSGVQTFSVYAKAGSLNWMAFTISGLSPSQSYFDLQNGALGTSGSEIIKANILSIGNGWYRCSVVVNGTATGVNIYPANDDNQVSVIGNIYIQDAQLEAGLVATDYIETGASTAQAGILEDMPRLDYSGGATCPSLLLEPQRTNLITQSEYIGDSTYITGGGAGAAVTRTNNYGISPDGTQNATRVEISRGSSYAELYNRITTTSGETYTLSFWAKSLDGTPTLYTAWNADYYNEITFTNEWQRYTYTFTASGTNNGFNLVTYTGLPTTSTSADLLIWGVQVELGSYSTSLIPTYGSSVTRNVDTAINNNNSNLPTGYPFSLFAEVDIIDTTSGYPISFNWSDSYEVYYAIAYYGGYWRALARNTTQTIVTSSVAPTIGSHKVCAVFTDTTISLYVDGALAVSSSNGQTFNSNTNDLLVGQLRNVIDDGTRSPIKQALVFNQALSNEEAIALTTI